MTKPKLWTPNFISVSLSNFFLFLTFYCLLVTLPIYAIQELHSPASEAGLVVTAFLFAAIISRPFAGQWIERLGIRLITILSLAVFFLVAVLYYFPHTMGILLLIRCLHGIGFGMATTVTGTIVADVIPNSRRGEGMGYFAMSTNLAMVLGPFLGLTIYQQWGIVILYTVSTLFALVALVIGFSISLPKKVVQKEDGSQNKSSMFSLDTFFELSAFRISLIAALFALVYSSLLSFVSVYAKGIGLESASSYFFVVYAIVLILSRPFTGQWFDIYGANKVMYPAILCFALGMILLSTANTILLFLLSAALIGLGWGTTFPFLQTLAIQDAPSSRKGLATATFLSVFDTGIAIGSFVVGVASVKIGFRSLYLYSTFIILFAMIVYYMISKKTIHSSHKKEHIL